MRVKGRDVEAKHLHSLADQVGAILSTIEPMQLEKAAEWRGVVLQDLHSPVADKLRDHSDALDIVVSALRDAEERLRGYKD